MIAVDTSILVGIMRREPDVEAIEFPRTYCVAATTIVETQIWCARNLRGGRSAWFERQLDSGFMRIDNFTPTMAEIAAEALRVMGRGSGHPANLNFGDAMVYAHARLGNMRLLCKGNDFCHTDLLLDGRSIIPA